MNRRKNANRVEISGENPVTLVKNDGKWFVNFDDKNFPAKQSRVDSLFDALTKKDVYAVRGNGGDIASKTGVGDDAPQGIKVYDGQNSLLDIIIGAQDAQGDVNLRRRASSEVRAGKDNFTSFTQGSRSAWENLRVFEDDAKFDASLVQRITVTPPEGEDGARPDSYTLVRDGDKWTAEGIAGSLNSANVDAFARNIAEAEADDFSVVPPENAMFGAENASALTIVELGDGRVIKFTMGEEEDGKKLVSVSGAPYAFLFSTWLSGRIFRAPQELIAEN